MKQQKGITTETPHAPHSTSDEPPGIGGEGKELGSSEARGTFGLAIRRREEAGSSLASDSGSYYAMNLNQDWYETTRPLKQEKSCVHLVFGGSDGRLPMMPSPTRTSGELREGRTRASAGPSRGTFTHGSKGRSQARGPQYTPTTVLSLQQGVRYPKRLMVWYG